MELSRYISFKCIKCKETKRVSLKFDDVIPGICKECENLITTDMKKEFMQKLDCMSVSQRLRRIENILYDNLNK